jgi:LAO/AO transport system kinase
VIKFSGQTGDGMTALWQQVLDHRARLTASGELAERRRAQQVKWMWALLEERLLAPLRTDPSLMAKLPELEAAVAEGRLSPVLAVDDVMRLLGR